MQSFLMKPRASELVSCKWNMENCKLSHEFCCRLGVTPLSFAFQQKDKVFDVRRCAEIFSFASEMIYGE